MFSQYLSNGLIFPSLHLPSYTSLHHNLSRNPSLREWIFCQEGPLECLGYKPTQYLNPQCLQIPPVPKIIALEAMSSESGHWGALGIKAVYAQHGGGSRKEGKDLGSHSSNKNKGSDIRDLNDKRNSSLKFVKKWVGVTEWRPSRLIATHSDKIFL